MKLLISAGVLVLVLAGQNVHAQGAGRSRLVTFEGALLKHSRHSGIKCGILYIHQVAKYRVDRVVAGKYAGGEMVVDHPACGGDVFEHVPVGSRVRLTVRVWRKYLVVTMHPGIRDDGRPKVFYVAEGEPAKVAGER